MPVSIQPAGVGSNLYRQAVVLREAVLRTPLGLTLTKEDLEADKSREHIVAIEQGEVIGNVSFSMEEATVVRIRQMAVSESARGRGIGAQVLDAVEARGRALGATRARLNARIGAYDFYRKQGYEAVSEEFLELGIPHTMMEKKLS